MSEAVRETPCTRCVHRSVCKHKEDFLKVIQAVNEASVHESVENTNKMSMKKVINYDCVGEIIVTCRYEQKERASSNYDKIRLRAEE